LDAERNTDVLLFELKSNVGIDRANRGRYMTFCVYALSDNHPAIAASTGARWQGEQPFT
jgi:hypothetical protein